MKARPRSAGKPVSKGRAGKWVTRLLKDLSFPGSAQAPDRWRVAAWWMVDVALAQPVFSWPLHRWNLAPGATSGLGGGTGIGFLYATLFTVFCRMDGLFRPASLRKDHLDSRALLKAAIWSVLFSEMTATVDGGRHSWVPLLIVASSCLHCALVIGFRAVLNRDITHPARAEVRARRVVIVGTGETAQRLASHLLLKRKRGVRFEGFVGDRPRGDTATIGRVQDLERLTQSRFLDEIIICVPDEPAVARRAVLIARGLRVDVKVVPEVYGCAPKNDEIEMTGDFPLLTLQQGEEHELRSLAKRGLDAIVAAGALLALTPALVAIALLVKLDSAGPVLYCAPRVGCKGANFLCYKFRTMQTGANQQQEALREKNERVGPFFKLRDDPRVTRVGKWLRRYSLDELPQLWNILRGEMSLVGPRPHPLDDHARYAPEHFQRLTVTPGLTGLWQVTARNDPSFEHSMVLDREYIDRQSLRMDLWILLRTVREVASGGGV